MTNREHRADSAARKLQDTADRLRLNILGARVVLEELIASDQGTEVRSAGVLLRKVSRVVMVLAMHVVEHRRFVLTASEDFACADARRRFVANLVRPIDERLGEAGLTDADQLRKIAQRIETTAFALAKAQAAGDADSVKELEREQVVLWAQWPVATV